MVQHRLQYYPSAPTYQTQVSYPGAVYSGQNVAYASQPIGNSRTGYQRYQVVHNNPIPTTTTIEPSTPTTTTTTTTTSTTQLPITVQTHRIEDVSAPIPAVRAPIHRNRILVSR